MNALKWTRALVMLALLMGASACENDLTEINENPNNPESVPVEALLSSGIWQLVSNNPGRGVFGEWTTLFHTNTWAQHTAQSAYNDEDNYAPRPGVNENIWAEMFAGALLDLKRVQEMAEESGDENLSAVADIMMVYGFLFLTDLFGDIPYFEALDLEQFPQPHFTPQSEIYPDLLNRLEAAAGQIQPGANASWASGDLIYGGNLARWQEFANSLRLRVAMRTQKTAFATTARQEFAQAWAANIFDDSDDNADLDWTGTQPSQNPIYENIILQGRQGDFRVSETMVDALQSRNDPRLPLFAAPAESDAEFRGLPNGFLPEDVGGGTTVNDYSWIGPALLAADAPSVLMSYAEVLFLGAEAAARGWIAGDPAALYRAGIEASMRQYGIAQTAINAYLAQGSVAYDGLNSILVQKWMALYLAGPEAYADVRRTGVPDLPLPGEAVIDELPARMPYPSNEGLFNPNFEPYATVEYTEPLWWM